MVCRIDPGSIRTVMADAGYESRKLARELKRRHGWRLHITKRRQRAFKVVGLTWIVERTFAWLGQKSLLEQRLRVEGPNFGSLHRPGDHPPHAQTARPQVKLLKHPHRPPTVEPRMAGKGGDDRIIHGRQGKLLFGVNPALASPAEK